MGYTNADLMRRLASAIQKGDKAGTKRAARLLLASQTACPHYPKDYKASKVPQDSPSGKYKKDGTINYCKRCGKVLGYLPPGVEAPPHRPTSWEKLMTEDLV